MKLTMTRATPLGVVAIEEEVPPQGVVDVTRRVRAALDRAAAELGAHPAPAPPPSIVADRTSDTFERPRGSKSAPARDEKG